VRLDQSVQGLRVPATDVEAVFSDGALVSVVENAARLGGPVRAASAGPDDALRAAVADLYPGRPVSTAGARRSGNVTTYAVQGFAAAPTVEKVALPTPDGGAAAGYVVATWDTDNVLTYTTVDGAGAVVDREVRTADDAYNVFPEDPDKDKQTLVSDPADLTSSPGGWLTGTQYSNHISGNNANAYLDRDNDNAPDADGASEDITFDAVWNRTAQPTTTGNQAVAVQNLFYLNNLIHDVLAKAGFDEGAGNFQATNYDGVGAGGDPVQAEAQDGGGTDNANFATPPDGQKPRMQMYLWSPPTSHQVVIGNKAYAATGASWGAQLDGTGRTGSLVVANDGTGTTSDACEKLAPVAAGAIVIADRGTCNFTDKALNAQTAGAAGIIIANNTAGAPIPMGGSNRRVTIPGVMVSQKDGATIKRSAGVPVTIRANADALLKDASLDSDVVWHEYGHGLTWRMIGRMDDALAGAIGEGMSDVLSVVVNDDPVVGEYSVSDPAGIRSHSYEGYPGTYGDITGTEVHADGELYGAIGWDLWKRYKNDGLGRDDILADLVDGMNYTPSSPTYEDMRDGIVHGLELGDHPDRVCWVWDSFAKYGVGFGATGTVRGKSVVVNESFKVSPGCGG
jgi:hypothetical protein